MKKILLATLIGSVILGGEAFAARKDCSYSPVQQLIRTARSVSDVAPLITNKMNLDIKPRCGGDVLQLAILRGNVEVLKYLLTEGHMSIDKKVSLADYPIADAPREVPLAFFAAYYAPSQEIMRALMANGMDLMGTDDKGETVLWYLNQNPVLMNTDIVDEMMQKLLLDPTVNGIQKIAQKTEGAQDDNDGKKRQDPRARGRGGKVTQIIDEEPDAPFNAGLHGDF